MFKTCSIVQVRPKRHLRDLLKHVECITIGSQDVATKISCLKESEYP
jgi:hypothetical protein